MNLDDIPHFDYPTDPKWDRPWWKRLLAWLVRRIIRLPHG